MCANHRYPNPHNGFTLIELLIVVSIIAIIGITAISSFSGLLSSQSTKTVGESIDGTLQSLDNAITNNTSTSYEVVFKTGSIGFVAKKDFHRQKNTVSLDFDFESGSGTLANTSGFTGTWVYTMFYRGRITGNSFISDSISATQFSLPANRRSNEHEIDNVLDDERIGSFLIRYYSDGDMTDTPPQIRLVSITGSTGPYDMVTLRNILGKRELIGPGGEKLDEVTLIFRDNEKEIPVVIKK